MTGAYRFFHVDRDGSLSEGQQLELRPAQLQRQHETEFVNQFFPDGLSAWGESMLDADTPLVVSIEGLDNLGLTTRLAVDDQVGVWLGDTAQQALRAGRNRLLEAMAEFVRRGRAPDKPSRLAAVYAYSTAETADVFRIDTNWPEAPVWRVAATPGAVIHEGDSGWLSLSDSTASFLQAMIAYWDGTIRPQALPTEREVLLPAPVAVVERVLHRDRP